MVWGVPGTTCQELSVGVGVPWYYLVFDPVRDYLLVWGYLVFPDVELCQGLSMSVRGFPRMPGVGLC